MLLLYPDRILHIPPLPYLPNLRSKDRLLHCLIDFVAQTDVDITEARSGISCFSQQREVLMTSKKTGGLVKGYKCGSYSTSQYVRSTRLQLDQKTNHCESSSDDVYHHSLIDKTLRAPSFSVLEMVTASFAMLAMAMIPCSSPTNMRSCPDATGR